MLARDEEAVRQAVAAGVSWVCANCVKFWAGVDLSLGRCAGQDCGGPMAGRAFEEYEGPELNWANCFVCGGCAPFQVTAPGRRSVGVCRRHLELVEAFLAGKIQAEEKTVGSNESRAAAKLLD